MKAIEYKVGDKVTINVRGHGARGMVTKVENGAVWVRWTYGGMGDRTELNVWSEYKYMWLGKLKRLPKSVDMNPPRRKMKAC